jgi:hypothetical protein
MERKGKAIFDSTKNPFRFLVKKLQTKRIRETLVTYHFFVGQRV